MLRRHPSPSPLSKGKANSPPKCGASCGPVGNPHQKRTMQLKHWIVTTAILAAFGTGQHVRADDTADSIKALQKQIEALDQKVKTLERKRELDQEASAE